MNAVVYLLLVNIYWSALYGFYALLLKRESFHQLNRMVLVGGLVLCGVLPLCADIDLLVWFVPKNTAKTVIEIGQVVQSTVLDSVREKGSMWAKALLTTYVLGLVFMCIRLIYRLLNLKKYFRNIEGHAFTFLKRVVVDPKMPQRDVILAHEAVHASHLHSIDLILVEIAIVFNWFNPFLYAIKAALRNLHEYQADDVASRKIGQKAYAQLLLSQQFGVTPAIFTNAFFDTFTLKQRIMMLTNQKSKRTAMLKYGLMVPAVALMLVGTSGFVSKKITKLPIVEPIVAVTEQAVNLVDPFLDKALFKSDTIYEKSTMIMPDGNSVFIESNMVEIPKDTAIKSEKLNVVDKDGKPLNPMWVVDGRIVKSLDGVDPSIIERMDVLKGEAATKQYGENGKNGVVIITTKLNIKGYDDIVLVTSEGNDMDEIWSGVEKPAEFPGGVNALMQFLASNIKYPVAAQMAKTQGKVFAEFVIRKNGKISDIRILKGIGSGCDEETVRVISTMPDWSPAMQNGKVVSSKFTLPINYAIEKKKN